jgi:signal transduction histidine kinase
MASIPRLKAPASAGRGGLGANSMNFSREQSDFLLRLCHEIRSPLRAMRAHSELLLHTAGKEEQASRTSAGFVVDGAKKLELLADGLARYSIALQLEPSTFQNIDAGVLLRMALARMQNELRDSASEVSYANLPKVSGNAERLSDVFEYLVSNAIRHSGRESTQVRIAYEKSESEFQFQVQDNGAGIEAAYLEAVFEPFTRLNRTNHNGPGLGLTVCRAILERHGGRIWAEDSAHGALVRFTLPATA